MEKIAATADTTEMQASAEAVALAYCSDADPGIRRIKSSKSFIYRTPDGKALREAKQLDRIKALVIPPAWNDVWIAPKANCHIQATGRDERGRKQYRYHERWTTSRDEVKFSNLVEFAQALPKLRRAIATDMRSKGFGRDKVLAAIVWLLDNAMIRVGNADYARTNNSFGLTTLRNRHAEVKGSTLRLTFKGKSGQEWDRKITDRRVAKIVKGVQDIPGQHLFQYLDGDGERRAISSNDVNGYIRTKGGEAFSSKHFRTWGGTVMALELFALAQLPESQKETARLRNEVIDAVAGQLGNTRAVCRKCYVHPRVFETWEAGRLSGELDTLRASTRGSKRGLSRQEALTLRWLQKKPRKRRGSH